MNEPWRWNDRIEFSKMCCKQWQTTWIKIETLASTVYCQVPDLMCIEKRHFIRTVILWATLANDKTHERKLPPTRKHLGAVQIQSRRPADSAIATRHRTNQLTIDNEFSPANHSEIFAEFFTVHALCRILHFTIKNQWYRRSRVTMSLVLTPKHQSDGSTYYTTSHLFYSFVNFANSFFQFPPPGLLVLEFVLSVPSSLPRICVFIRVSRFFILKLKDRRSLCMTTSSCTPAGPPWWGISMPFRPPSPSHAYGWLLSPRKAHGVALWDEIGDSPTWTSQNETMSASSISANIHLLNPILREYEESSR